MIGDQQRDKIFEQDDDATKKVQPKERRRLAMY